MYSSSSIYHQLTSLLQQYSHVVLATVVSTQGSTPQKAGSSILVGEQGLLAGSIGGGITEKKVVQEAQIRLKTKKSGLFSFELHGEIEKGSESICGGSMKVFIDASPQSDLSLFMQIDENIKKCIPGILITRIDQSEPGNVQFARYWHTKDHEVNFSDESGIVLGSNLKKMIDCLSSLYQTIEMATPQFNRNDLVLLESIRPKPNLIIAGAGHIGKALSPLAKTIGFSVTVWDDRPDYADQAILPDADVVLTGTVDELAKSIQIQDTTYLVILTRGHKSDAEVLKKFIGSNAAYIGMIGSKAKVAQMKTSFIEKALATPEQWDRIFTPVGLNIGAKTIEEIAVSIAAQLIEVKNKKQINQ